MMILGESALVLTCCDAIAYADPQGREFDVDAADRGCVSSFCTRSESRAHITT